MIQLLPNDILNYIIQLLHDEDIFFARNLAPSSSYMNELIKTYKNKKSHNFSWETCRSRFLISEYSPYFMYKNVRWRVLFFPHDNPFHGKMSKTRAQRRKELQVLKHFPSKKSSVAIYLECENPDKKSTRFSFSISHDYYNNNIVKTRTTTKKFLKNENWGFCKLKYPNKLIKITVNFPKD